MVIILMSEIHHCIFPIQLVLEFQQWLIPYSMSTSLRFLSPCLRPRFQPVSTAARAAHLRFYSALQPLLEDHEILTVQQKAGDVERRLKQLDAIPSQLYPRVKPHNGAIDCKAFIKRYDSLKPDESQEGEVAIIRGML
jgi:hypothetical protein